MIMQDFSDAQKAMDNATCPKERYEIQNQMDRHIKNALLCHEDPEWISGPARKPDPKVFEKMQLSRQESILGFVEIDHHQQHLDRERKDQSAQEQNAGEWGPSHCARCNGRFVTCQRTATMTCTDCGATHRWQCPLVESLDLLWSENSRAKQPGYSYKQSNHMWSWILRIQGKEAVDIPEHVLVRLRAEFQKIGVDRRNVTPLKIRAALKHLKLPKYYNHVHTLQHMLFGVQPPQMSDEQEQSIMAMFNDIIEAYSKIKKNSETRRVNMLSYSYLLRKIMEMLGYDEFLEQLVMLKHRDRLQEQERIWQRICQEIPGFHFKYTSM